MICKELNCKGESYKMIMFFRTDRQTDKQRSCLKAGLKTVPVADMTDI